MQGFRAAAITNRAITRSTGDYIVLMDGGSKDGTPDVARELGLDVLSQREGRGKGVALRQSFSYFLDSGDDVLVMLDSDGSYDPADMPRLLHHLVENDLDAV